MKIFDGERYDTDRTAWALVQIALLATVLLFIYERVWDGAVFAFGLLALFFAYRPRWKDYYVDKNS